MSTSVTITPIDPTNQSEVISQRIPSARERRAR
jgi:hypothetical protein